MVTGLCARSRDQRPRSPIAVPAVTKRFSRPRRTLWRGRRIGVPMRDVTGTPHVGGPGIGVGQPGER